MADLSSNSMEFQPAADGLLMCQGCVLQEEDMPVLAATHARFKCAHRGIDQDLQIEAGLNKLMYARALLSHVCIERSHGSSRRVWHSHSSLANKLARGMLKPGPSKLCRF